MNSKMSPADTNSRNSTFIKSVTYGFLFISFVYVSLRVVFDYQIGGTPWRQGDWLINNAAGNVRRGPFGSAILSISDQLNVSPLLVVSACQIIALAVLFISFGVLITRVRDPRIGAILAISPALFTVFWVATPPGSLRKELLAFSGLSLVSVGAIIGNWTALWIGVIIFCVSIVSHEAMVLFTPTFFIIIYVTGLHHKSSTQALVSALVVFFISTLVIFFTAQNSQVVDVSMICAALTERGLSESICGGAIRWLSYDSSHGFSLNYLSIRSLGWFLISYAAALAPIFYVIWLSKWRVVNGMILLALALPFAPLYLVGVDWGRWMSFHVFSAVVILSCALASDKFPMQRQPSNRQVLSLLILAFLISPDHVIGIKLGGVIHRALSVFESLLR